MNTPWVQARQTQYNNIGQWSGSGEVIVYIYKYVYIAVVVLCQINYAGKLLTLRHMRCV
jgi:hypothetical protein